MVKIKTKKEMNLPELIEWGFKQEELPPLFYGSKEGSLVQFTPAGWVNITAIKPTDTFTVEIEEEITEDTKLDLVERFIGGTGSVCYTSHSMSIKECLKRSPKECTTTHFYIENDNRDLVLIWRDGNLVEYKGLQHENRTLKDENKALRLQADEYFDLWQEAIKK